MFVIFNTVLNFRTSELTNRAGGIYFDQGLRSGPLYSGHLVTMSSWRANSTPRPSWMISRPDVEVAWCRWDVVASISVVSLHTLRSNLDPQRWFVPHI